MIVNPNPHSDNPPAVQMIMSIVICLINVNNCSLYTLLTATDRKLQKNHKKAILTT